MLFHPQTTYGSDRFRQIFIDHWDRWLDLHEEDIPAAQRAYVRKTIQKMMGCRNPQSCYARYVCPGCGDERIVPFSCKTRFCPSPSTERTGSVCGKVRTDEWVNLIAQELLDVPHLHLTLTTPSRTGTGLGRPGATPDLPRRPPPARYHAQSRRRRAAVRQGVESEHPGPRIGLIYSVHTFG